MTTALGLDIGGANLKLADLDGNTHSEPFAMWQRHQELTATLQQLSWLPDPDLVGLTMTAELADCFATKSDGVHWIIDSVCQAFPQSAVRVWLTTGEFAEPDDAVELPTLVAAANWHALATWAGRCIPDGPGLLLDIGSTTSDIIPLLDGLPASSGLSDLERLAARELVYTGIGRTPLCAVLNQIDLGGTILPVAAEWFATMQDVWLLSGHLAEDSNDHETADGRPRTCEAAMSRVAHMLCCDRSELSDSRIMDIAQQFQTAQITQLQAAVAHVTAKLTERLTDVLRDDAQQAPQIIISGAGTFLAEQVLAQSDQASVLNLTNIGPRPIADAACAFAVACLVFERCRDDLLEAVPFVPAPQ